MSTNLTADQDNKNTITLALGNSMKMELILVQPGSFIMGTDRGREDSKPAHEVTISKAYYLGKFEVTQEQYEALMGNNPSGFKGPKRPVDNVSWFTAVDFCKALSKQTGRTCRLPTEAEWEYACRAGTTNAFSSGRFKSSLKEYAWTGDNSDKQTHKVGLKKPNPWGFHDIHGNVWEWCMDWYEVPYSTNGPSIDPRGPKTGKWRVHRGGSWYEPSWAAASATRARIKPHLGDTHYGIRVCVEK